MSLNSSLLRAASALPSLVDGVPQANQFVSLAATDMNTARDFAGPTEPDNVEPISDIGKFLAAFGTADSEQPDDHEQNQDDNHALPDTGALLVPGPAGPGTSTGPVPETVPVAPAPPIVVPQPLPPAPQPGPVPPAPVEPDALPVPPENEPDYPSDLDGEGGHDDGEAIDDENSAPDHGGETEDGSGAD
jgi:hypothetical protein